MGLIRLNNQSLTDVTALPSVVAPVFKRVYTANSQTTTQFTTGFTTLLTMDNVVVNSGEKVYLSYHMTTRSTTATGQKHTAYQIAYSGSSAGTVGDTGWAFGINDTAQAWQLDTSYICLNDFAENPFNATGTFTMNLQGKSANTSGYWAGESNGAAANYTSMNAMILVG